MRPSGNSNIHAHEQHTLHDKTHVSSGKSYIHAHEHYTLHDKTHVSSSNTVGVAKGAHHPQWITYINEIG